MPDGDVAPTNQQQVNQQAPQQPQPLGAQGRPGFFRSLLASLLTGVQAGVMAPQTAQGPSQAADIAQALPQQRIQQQQQRQGFQSQQELTKARTALAQVQLQQTQLMVARMAQENQDSFLDGARKLASESIKGGSQLLFDNVSRQDAHDKVIELLKQDPDAHVMALPSVTERGQWSVLRMTKGLVPKAYSVPLKGANGVPDESIDVPENMDIEEAKNMVIQRSRDHATRIEAAGKIQQTQDQQEGALKRTKLTIAGKEDVAKIQAQARDQKTTANNSGDVMYRQIVTRLHQDNARLATFLASNTVTGDFRKDPLVQLVNRDLQEKADYEAKNPQVLKGKGGGFSVPEGAPKPTKDNQVLKDAKGNIIAKSQGGAWVAP